MNEAETRAEHIDPALKAVGWGVVEGSRIRREYCITLGRIEGFGHRGKPLKADYILEYRNTKLAAIDWSPDGFKNHTTGGYGSSLSPEAKVRYMLCANAEIPVLCRQFMNGSREPNS